MRISVLPLNLSFATNPGDLRASVRPTSGDETDARILQSGCRGGVRSTLARALCSEALMANLTAYLLRTSLANSFCRMVDLQVERVTLREPPQITEGLSARTAAKTRFAANAAPKTAGE
jgi:hypothetical protein